MLRSSPLSPYAEQHFLGLGNSRITTVNGKIIASPPPSGSEETAQNSLSSSNFEIVSPSSSSTFPHHGKIGEIVNFERSRPSKHPQKSLGEEADSKNELFRPFSSENITDFKQLQIHNFVSAAWLAGIYRQLAPRAPLLPTDVPSRVFDFFPRPGKKTSRSCKMK